ncbi:AbrB/MazE/SpoVT family DNA-binding domain-containing protein [Acidobacteria bacterium AH-259-G07]|nr:AbrB/MazE/SpoVT family DNA-binding domain-containing protein [Acidobacteria bacterium AH-259-L09]MDA2927228.1 AbrB/MazE/SpoVT family DNA-binding domain-containing protein [Acidobacteria bacterium AH-259-G07]
MAISTTTPKGQIVIPAALRKKYGIEKGTKVSILDGDGVIIVRPLGKSLIEESFGILKKHAGRSVLKGLEEERKREAKQ